MSDEEGCACERLCLSANEQKLSSTTTAALVADLNKAPAEHVVALPTHHLQVEQLLGLVVEVDPFVPLARANGEPGLRPLSGRAGITLKFEGRMNMHA